MTMLLKPYPEYKDSGVKWLGTVPSHWHMGPALACYEPKLVRNKGMQEERVLSLSYGRIIIKPLEKLHGLVPESFETYQIVEPGDIIVRPTDLQNDHTSLRIGLVKDKGIITSAYLCLRCKEPISSDYGYNFLNVWDLTKAIYGYGSGLRQNLDFVHFRRMPVAYPPLPEQQQIVRFLRAAESRINRFVRNKRRLIALLKEQKQAIINQAVTRGIDPNVRLKPSGIDWLGDIPEHWEPVKLGFFIDLLSGFAFQSEGFTNNSSDIRLLRGVNISPGSIRWGDVVRWPVPNDNRLERYFLNAGDTVIGMDRPWISTGMRVAVIKEEDTPSLLLQRVGRIRAKKPLCQEYLNLLLLTDQFVNYFQPILTGISVPHISPGQIAAFRFALPPENEQVQILSHINKDSCALEKAISRTEHEIELINEYRTRLVADVVTGKVDVRSVKLEERSVNENEDIDEEAIIEDNGIEDDDEAFTEGAEGDDDA